MTAPARITQADMDRVTKSAKAAYGERARVVFDFRNATAEILPGDPGQPVPNEPNPWKAEAGRE